MRTVVAVHELLPKGLHLESLSFKAGRVSISVASGASRSRCSVCDRSSSRAQAATSAPSLTCPGTESR